MIDDLQMFGDNTDESWEKLGRSDPYYGVLTHKRFRGGRLDDQARQEFFESGREHMSKLLHRVESLLGPIHRGKALDFGCGVGRLAIPLAEQCRFQAVTGVDVSESMLREARSNSQRLGVDCVEFVLSDDSLSRLSGNYDLVHSFIVLQHIPLERGMAFVSLLLDRVAPGGVAALQMPFYRPASALRRVLNYLSVRIRLLHIVGNVLKRRPWREPPMQMNRYDMNLVLRRFKSCGLPTVLVEFVDDSDNVGAYLIARKPIHSVVR